jgi:hypothetical protein
MAEPLSIIGAVGSIAGIIDVLGRSISTIYALRSQWKDADLSLLNLVSQLTALRVALNKIKKWTELDRGEPQLQLVMDLDGSITCCEILVENIDAQVSSMLRKPDGTLEVSGKLKLILSSKEMDNLQKMIERQTSALTLLLTACNW